MKLDIVNRQHHHQHETTPCPRKKQATLIFAITSPSVEIFFTIFETFCSGIIHA